MHSSISIDVAAPAGLVFRLARDTERWSTLLPHYVRSRGIERRPDGSIVVGFIAIRSLIPVLGVGIPVAWRARTWSEPETLRLRFVHLAGATRGMDVTWRIESVGPACRVTIEHAFSPRLPGFARFVDMVFTRPIAGRTLRTFRAIAEGAAAGEVPG